MSLGNAQHFIDNMPSQQSNNYGDQLVLDKSVGEEVYTCPKCGEKEFRQLYFFTDKGQDPTGDWRCDNCDLELHENLKDTILNI